MASVVRKWSMNIVLVVVWLAFFVWGFMNGTQDAACCTTFSNNYWVERELRPGQSVAVVNQSEPVVVTANSSTYCLYETDGLSGECTCHTPSITPGAGRCAFVAKVTSTLTAVTGTLHIRLEGANAFSVRDPNKSFIPRWVHRTLSGLGFVLLIFRFMNWEKSKLLARLPRRH